jgi:K+-sensing histidine kinase KdpD
VRASAVGVLGAVAFVLVLDPLADLTRAVQALLLVVPVVVVAVVVGRLAAYAVAAAASVGFSLLIPPVGSVWVEHTQDLVSLVAFFVVAMAVGTVVARRIELLGVVERQRAALLRSVSHDLRTPLASIRAAASDLAEFDQLPTETARRFADLIGTEAERLDRLVANLLSLSRIEAGSFAPARQAVDVAELVAATTGRLRRVFSGTALVVDVPAGLPAVQADYTQLDQLLTNLVENAARHAPKDGTVVVSARANRGHLTLSVADDGPGVDPVQADELFRPFRSGAIAGVSGIGLAICRAVAEGHGGTIRVGSAPSGGALFTVRIPLG